MLNPKRVQAGSVPTKLLQVVDLLLLLALHKKSRGGSPTKNHPAFFRQFAAIPTPFANLFFSLFLSHFLRLTERCRSSIGPWILLVHTCTMRDSNKTLGMAT
ncbi:hypothetical protein BJV82DRAFT_191353 [Fennellomyces sp. T-0311]|nr:hypothetical protein BJV82DRAFT_191353 [Fennellomyces sp. T-0311]